MKNNDFGITNQELIDRYIGSLKNKYSMITSEKFEPIRRKSLDPVWVGRKMYYIVHRHDALYFSHTDAKMTEIQRMNLINFNILDMKFERMIIKCASIMNGMFKNTNFFRFCLKALGAYEKGENEYQDRRNVVLNCRFVNCTFMNSCAVHTDWINCEFINCTFINTNLCCSGSEYQNCKFENNLTLNIRI